MNLKVDNHKCIAGIHFDGPLIHGVRLECEGDLVEIGHAASVPFEGPLGDTRSIEALRRLFSQLDIPRDCPIHVTTEFEKFYTMHLSIGDGPLAQMRKMAEMAYRKEINVGDDPVIFDYERVGLTSDTAAPQVTLHAFSVEASLKENLCKLVEAAGQKASALFPEIFALRNLIVDRNQAEPVALLMLDAKELRIAVIHNHKYIFTRSFKSGQDAILSYISKTVNKTITRVELEKALNEEGREYATQLAQEIRSAFSYITERMQQQIERAFKFYSGRLKLPPIEQLLLYTASSVITRNMVSLLKPNYSSPVNGLGLSNIETLGLQDSILPVDETSYMLATGAAMAGLHPCPNLLYTHADQEMQRKTYRAKTALMLTLSAFALICISVFLAQIVLLAPRMIEKRSFERQLAAHPVLLTREIVDAKAQLCRKRLRDLRVLSEHYSLQGYFFELCSLLPPELRLETFHVELYDRKSLEKGSDAIGRVSLRGIIAEHGLRQQALLTKFLVEMGSSSVFKNINREPISPAELATYSKLDLLPFRVSCELTHGDSSLSMGGKK